MDHAFLFDPTGGGANIDLGTLGGYSSDAYSINDTGQIVGMSLNSSVNYHACLFDEMGAGENIDLGTLGGFSSTAWSINNIGQIVGNATNSSGNWRACLFDPTGQGNNIDLNTLIDPSYGWILTSAQSINNNGWIVGSMTNTTGDTHAFLLTPEPTSAILLILGAALLRRKK
jgi:probable HAF family extracellular repeat protein